MVFKICYILFLISSIVLGSQYIGFISFRQLFALVMFCLCIREPKNLLNENSNKFFLAFVLLFGFTSVLHGYAEDYLKTVLAYYFVAFVGLWSTMLAFKKSYGMVFVHTLVTIGLFDAIITILQSFANPIALSVGFMFASEEIEFITDRFNEGEFVSMALMGIFGAVYNGYFLLVSAILSTVYILHYKHCIKFVPFILCIIGSFMCQQRAPFIILIVFIGFFLIKYSRHLKPIHKFMFFIIAIVAIIYIYPMFVEFSEKNNMRYSSTGLDGTGREHIYKLASEYILNNFFTGNIYDFKNIYGHLPHMLFYSMIIYGGIFGFISVTVALFIQIRKSLSAILRPLNAENIMSLSVSCALIAFTANSFTHNYSIVSGDILYWILWGGVLSLNKYQNQYYCPLKK